MNLLKLAVAGLLVAVARAAAADDLVLADFEGKDYGNWQIEGTAFGAGPAQGSLPHQKSVGGFLGHGLANSYHGGDKATGTLTSPDFVISRKFISFLIGGGGHPGKTCLNLLVDGQIVRTATGPNTTPGGSEDLTPDAWNVAEFAGRTARLQIVDQFSGTWGHINVDQTGNCFTTASVCRSSGRRGSKTSRTARRGRRPGWSIRRRSSRLTWAGSCSWTIS